jgi:hypothetical protein
MENERLVAPDVFPPVETRRSSRFPVEDVAHRQALRLTFSFDGPQMQLTLRETVEMTLPPSMALTDEPPGAAFWYELHDGEHTPLYRRTQRHPLDSTVEVRTGDPERPLAHMDSGRAAGTFTLLVPQLPDTQSVVLYGWSAPPDDDERDGEPAPTELARFALGAAVDEDAVSRDTIPPTTVSDAVAAYRTTAVIHLRAFDNMGDVARTVYRVDDGDEHEGLTVTVEEPGRHRLLFWSVDRAGNVEAENVVTFTIGRPVGVE